MNMEYRELVRYQALNRAMWRKFIPPSDGHTAAVLVGRDTGRLELVDRRPSASEAFYSSPPTGVFWVDISARHQELTLQLPAAEGVVEFVAEMDLSWRIGDPIRAVQEKVVRGEDIYRPFLERHLRVISREFEVGDFVAAEERINAHLGDRRTELPCGLTLLTCTVKLSPESGTHSHFRKRAQDRHDEERRRAEHEARMQTSRLEQEIAELKQQHQFDLERQRMRYYEEALQAGELGVFALRLASNRDDVNEVIQVLMRQKRLDFEAAHGVLKALLEQRLVNKRDVQDIMARASKIIADQWNPAAISAASSTAAPAQELASGKPPAKDPEVIGGDDDDDDDD